MSTAAQRNKLADHAATELLAMGATAAPLSYDETMLEYTLATKFGPLRVLPDPDNDLCHRGRPAAITLFCRFHDENAVSAFKLDGNKFSGKWNHHDLDMAGLKAVLEQIKGFLT